MPRGSKPGERRGGRKPGTPNKITKGVREALTVAFDRVGGVAALVRWGKENPTEFYKLWGKLLPQQVKQELTGANGGAVQVDANHTINIPERIDRLATALAGARGRQGGGGVAGDGVREPVDTGPYQGGAVLDAG